DINVPFDDFRARYERAVPAFDLATLGGFATWNAVVDDAVAKAPYGFLRYGTVDAGPLFSVAGHKARSVTYLMGNHTIAETMYGTDAGVMLYAPLRTVLYEDRTGRVRFAIDQPGTRFSSFGNKDIAATGKRLDAKLAVLLRDLALPVPKALLS
ncbi:MAG TPA: hypothetical protein VGQ80_17950, partial [Acidimicrobiia bacterium]|nr:hypothetical protein [Acidimicrobiia bacterium]